MNRWYIHALDSKFPTYPHNCYTGPDYNIFERVDAPSAEDACFMFLVNRLGYPLPTKETRMIRIVKIESGT